MKFGLIVVAKDYLTSNDDEYHVYHFCGFENEPTQDDIDILYAELKSDPEFGLSDFMDTLQIVTAPSEVVKAFEKILEKHPAQNELPYHCPEPSVN